MEADADRLELGLVFRGRRINRKHSEGMIPMVEGSGTDPLHSTHRLTQKEKVVRR